MNFSGHRLKANRSRSYVMFSLVRCTELTCLNNPQFNTNYARFIVPSVAEEFFRLLLFFFLSLFSSLSSSLPSSLSLSSE